MSPQMRQMMKTMNPDEDAPAVEVELEINPRHDLIKKLNGIQADKPELAKLVANQLFDGALLTAGLLDDRKELIARNYELMEQAMT